MIKTSSSSRLWVTWGIFVGAFLGLWAGWKIGAPMEAVQWMGDLFLSALKWVVVPLIVTSLVVGIAGLGDIRRTGRFGVMTLVYFSLTTLAAVLIGIVLVLVIRPGEGFTSMAVDVPERLFSKAGFGFRDFILNFLGGGPDHKANIFYSLANGEMLPVVVFSLLFGCVLTLVENNGPVVQVFKGLYEAVMILVKFIMWFAPFGIFGLVAAKVGSFGGGDALMNELAKLGLYISTVLAGLAVHAVIVLPLLLFFLGKRSPFGYARGMSEALLTAFSTASSAATLPVTTRGVTQNNGVSDKAANFVLPVGATINMDGTALYEGVAVIFIAQTLGVDLPFSSILVVFVLSALAAMAAAAIPEAGLVTMVVILQALHLPIESIGLLLAVDWFLDRCRTTVNVWGDAVGSAVLDQLGKGGKVKLEAL